MAFTHRRTPARCVYPPAKKSYRCRFARADHRDLAEREHGHHFSDGMKSPRGEPAPIIEMRLG